MKKLILIAGAAAFAFGAPVLAEPGKGKGNQGGQPHAGKPVGKPQASGNAGRRVVPVRGGGRLYALGARGSCPPGLAKKGNGCMPPGQARKLFNVGQRYNRNFGNLWSYNQIPYELRSRYAFDRGDRFYYHNGYLYQVDPTTMMVQLAVSALLG